MSTQIPDGYRKDAKGRLIPEESIKPIDLARDELVQELAAKALELNRALAQFKAAAFGDVETFVQLSAEEYGVSLVSFDGKFKIQRAVQDRITLDERIEAAKTLIYECLDEWTDDSRKEIKTIIKDVFRTDKEGKLRVGEILSLRRYDFDDPRWIKAMDILADALRVIGTTSYVRFYQRVGDSDRYRPISLTLAEV